MNRRTLWIVLLSVCALAVAGCGGGGHLKVTISTAPTTLAAGASSNVIATVTHDPAAGGVTWSCTPSDACGSFNPTQTPSGTATVYTAPPAAPASSQGVVTILATSVTNTARTGSANVTITGVATANFVFYATGEDDAEGAGYSIAGVVTIAQDGTGDVVGGEQDYNDGPAGNTSPQPLGDTITGGSLALASDGSGNAILTLTTSNANLPNGGTEVFALAFANANHASIVEFDGTATSLGSLDLQTSTAMPVSSSFAFVSVGVDPSFDPVAEGGVFAVDANGVITGTVDQNDNGDVTPGITIPAATSLGPTDALGRGTIEGSLDGSGAIINFYIVGSEVARFIDVDTTDTAVGSAYGQGSAATTFSSASIGQSVFQIGNSYDFYGAVGQFTTSAEVGGAKPKSNAPIREGASACTGTSTCLFTGVGDLNDLEHGDGLSAAPINGTYTINANGYGSMDFDSFDTVATLGVYAVDPMLNILDPNNTSDTADSGGALIAEMDINLVGIGSIVPQTDVTVASFAGNYAFGAQGDTSEGDEFDFVGTTLVTPGATTSTFVGEGALSDPADALGTGGLESSTATFNATATPDPVNAGRYTLGPLTVASSAAPPDFDTLTFTTVSAYQASGGQLFWLEVDEGSYFLGPLEQGPGPSSDARKAQAKSNIKKH
jgi:hypothetical protein